jgi:hypothetical protein
MLKSLHELLEPDPRFAADVLVDSATENSRPMTIGDLWAIVEQFRLLPTVPTDVQTQIDNARHAFI